MKTKLTLATVLWCIMFLCLTVSLVYIFPEVPDAVGIIFLIFSMVISYPASIFLTKLLTNQSRTHTIRTGLSAVEGSLSGPAFGLPPKTTVRYKRAAQSPEVTVYQENGEYVGFTVDFGNGIVGCVHNRMIIRHTQNNLSVKVIHPDGTEQLVNWK